MKIIKHLNRVTPFSKILAMVMFVLLPFAGFYLGREYQKLVDFNQNSQEYSNVSYSAKIREVTPSEVVKKDSDEFQDFVIPELNTKLKLPSSCRIATGNNPLLEEGNKDYAINCNYPKKEATLKISINPSTTGDDFGGLNLKSMSGNSYSTDNEFLVFLGKKYTLVKETAASWGNKSGFYFQASLTKPDKDSLDQTLTINKKEVTVRMFIEDVSDDASLETNATLVEELKKILSSARSN